MEVLPLGEQVHGQEPGGQRQLGTVERRSQAVRLVCGDRCCHLIQPTPGQDAAVPAAHNRGRRSPWAKREGETVPRHTSPRCRTCAGTPAIDRPLLKLAGRVGPLGSFLGPEGHPKGGLGQWTFRVHLAVTPTPFNPCPHAAIPPFKLTPAR